MALVSKPNWRQDEMGQWWYYVKVASEFSTQVRYRGTLRKCDECGNEFPDIVSRRHPERGVFCTRHCAGLHKNPPALPPEWSAVWRGGRYTSQRGYVLVYKPDHHTIVGRGTFRKYVLEHRLMMEEMLGRPLLATEWVHHKNGRRDDNRPENLELRAKAHGPGATHPHCETCTCFEGTDQ